MSDYKGVSYKRATRKYQATTIINSELIHIGTFMEERDAAKAVDLYRLQRGLDAPNILKPFKK